MPRANPLAKRPRDSSPRHATPRALRPRHRSDAATDADASNTRTSSTHMAPLAGRTFTFHGVAHAQRERWTHELTARNAIVVS
ncbi:hypothetical protein PINS_up022544 [Pythium insidiosum]|nr:hypothetical protein PINS_up022544 [Pythium insidiosum]